MTGLASKALGHHLSAETPVLRLSGRLHGVIDAGLGTGKEAAPEWYFSSDQVCLYHQHSNSITSGLQSRAFKCALHITDYLPAFRIQTIADCDPRQPSPSTKTWFAGHSAQR
jgi:hypothetical protein